jgi:DNA-directed RNA polymerase specialized sigma24 family protein
VNAGAFESLLQRLSPDRSQAAIEFERQRRYLIALLTYAGANDPEHLADTTLDRAAKRLSSSETIDDIRAWLRGAARKVLLESQTEQRRESIAAVGAAQSAGELRRGAEADHSLLQACLGRLPKESRDLIEGYYQPRENSLLDARRRLAMQLGISSENLRTRALRIRKTLEECLRKHRAEAREE